MMIVPTTSDLVFKDPDIDPPPRHDKLLLLSKYGVASIGKYDKTFHVGWVELPKIPDAIYDKIRASQR